MIGIISGSGLQVPKNLKIKQKTIIRTPFGIPSAPLICGTLYGQEVAFLTRHGLQNTIPPHLVNYCANIWVLHHIGCKEIIAFSLMCSISPEIKMGHIAIPDQLIDYTWDRKSTFFNSQIDTVKYTEFAEPYAVGTRKKLIKAVSKQSCGFTDEGIYGITQGPRYETRAEIRRYQRDGCVLLGMTGMPEAALAQEIQIDYAVCGLVTNSSEERSSERKKTDGHFGNANEMFEPILRALLS
ncbi:MAG: S-methyl-5'-thioinosine phosphorylase [Ostreibacterium sp.]